MKLYYSDHHTIPLPPNHRFPMEKYLLLRKRLQASPLFSKYSFIPTKEAKWEDIKLAHCSHYIEKLTAQTLSEKEAKPIGFPLSPELIIRSRSSVDGFIKACFSALEDGHSANLSGGTHHAHFDRGEGFCVFNDFAIAALKLLTEKRVKNILLLDLDVHQGNGNSSLLGKTSEVVIVSLHGKNNYPYRKIPSTYDFELADETRDEEYLLVLETILQKLSKKSFDIILYQAGVDVLETDKLGKLSLTHAGVQKRDEIVFSWAKKRNIPLAMALGGGYANPLEHTIQAHFNSFEKAVEIF